MKTHLLSYRTKKIAVVLFVSLFALWNTQLKAQDTNNTTAIFFVR